MQFNVAKIAVSVATYLIDKPYSYLIPTHMRDDIKVGARVLLPFGRGNKKVEGIVLMLCNEQTTKGFKNITLLLDDTPIIDNEMIRLAHFMQKRYFATFYDIIKTMIPTGQFFNFDDRYILDESHITDEVLFFHENFIATTKLKGYAKKTDENTDAINFLVDKKVLRLETISKAKITEKKTTLYSLTTDINNHFDIANRGSAREKRTCVVDFLADGRKATDSEINYVTGASKAVLKTLVKQGVLEETQIDKIHDLNIDFTIKKTEVELSGQQQDAFDFLLNQMNTQKYSQNLLFGVTGSGKTHVFIKLIQENLKRGMGTIVLMPEIALTSHLLSKFTEYFGTEVAIIHSKLSVTERSVQWKKIKDGSCKIAIGTRSAIFAPFDNLGLVIIDEEHEKTYQSENNPRYNAIEVAKFRCFRKNIPLVLASATPSVDSFYDTQTNNSNLIKMTDRFGDATLPNVTIYDMKDMTISGRYSSIGNLLKDEITENLNNGEQTILYLNRRGNSKQYQCVACGNVPECTRCSTSMTFHSTNERLMCHLCGFSMSAPIICPACDSRHIKTDVFGTQKVEIEISEMFPTARVLRLDADTTKKKDAHSEILEKFKAGQADILIGTQMVTKGLDFENATLVGVIDADQALFSENYDAFENVYAKITQVVGRSGRQKRPGRAVIQTFNPLHPVLQLAKNQQYEKFYELEIDRRMLLNFPPICDLFSFVFVSAEESRVIRSSLNTMNLINSMNLNLQALGPVPAKLVKINNNYRYIISIRLYDSSLKTKFISNVLKNFNIDKMNRNVNVYVDLNGEI